MSSTPKGRTMSFEDHVSLQAQAWRIPNEPRLLEKDLRIAALEFDMPDGSKVMVQGDDNNKAGRLCVQSHASSPSGGDRLSYLPLDTVRSPIEAFFAKRWKLIDPDNPESQKLLRGLHYATGVHIIWK
jgi:hypothetical protein